MQPLDSGKEAGVAGVELTPLVKTPKSQLIAEQPSAKKTGAYQNPFFLTFKDKEAATIRWKATFPTIKSHSHQMIDPQT